MKHINNYIQEKLKINKDKSFSELITDDEIIYDNGLWKKTREVILKYVPDFDEYKYYIYDNLKTVGEKYQGRDTHQLISFVYSLPPELKRDNVIEGLKKDIVEIKTKSGKQVFNGEIKVEEKEQNLRLYYNQ